jgi:hypothetical protein
MPLLPRLIPIALLAATALAVGGCGGDDDEGGGSTGGGQEEQVRAAVHGYLTAVAEGDGDAACELLSAASRATVERLAEQVDAEGCVEAFENAVAQAEVDPDAAREVLDGLEIADVDIDGDRATVSIRRDGAEESGALVREDGAWRVDIGGEDAQPQPATVTQP